MGQYGNNIVFGTQTWSIQDTIQKRTGLPFLEQVYFPVRARCAK
uniref:Uncharacterized protein n=1 Tax=Vitis vinifera TaxID=29760 RepID=F6I522_VITVI